jgi:hypothetical protein
MLINVEPNLEEVQTALDNLVAEQIPAATMYALTQVAKEAQKAVERAMPRYLDRPTPFTLRAVRTIPATKRRLVSSVEIKDGKASAAGSRDSAGKPIKQLGHQVEGGTRPLKPHERLLQTRGLMPRGWYAVPGKDIPLNQYGNVPSSLINRVLSQLQSHSVFYMDRNESAASKARQYRSKTKRLQRYFVVMPGNGRGLIPGVWERTTLGFGSAIRPLFIYVQTPPRYQKRLPFNEIVQATVSAQLASKFREGFEWAMRTARPK